MINRHEKASCPSTVQEPQRERVSLTEMPVLATRRVSQCRVTALVSSALACFFRKRTTREWGGFRISGNRENMRIAGVKPRNPALPFEGDETVFALVLDCLAVLERGHLRQVLKAGRNPVDPLGCKGGGGIDLAGRGSYGDRLAAPLVQADDQAPRLCVNLKPHLDPVTAGGAQGNGLAIIETHVYNTCQVVCDPHHLRNQI